MLMYSVILGGGSGTRLWPVSRHHFPKQFHVFSGKLSLFQETVGRCAEALDSEALIVLSNNDYRFLVAEQLDAIGAAERRIILEPAARNTAPAIALAAHCVQDSDPDGVMLVAPSDHMISDRAAFNRSIRRGVEAARAGRLVTLGIEPAYPATGYGYIQRGAGTGETHAETDGWLPVEAFVEKPDLATATAFVDSGAYYWNSGIFLFTAAVYLRELETHRPELAAVCREAWMRRQCRYGFDRAGEAFIDAEPVSIDYAVMEKTGASVVVPHSGDWNDIGSWSGVTAMAAPDAQGNTVTGNVLLHDVSDSLVHASSRLVAGVGLDNAVIVETKDAVLVSTRANDQDVKHIVAMLKAQGAPEADFHARVLRPWGGYENLDQGEGFQVKRLFIKPGASISLQRHFHRSEHWVVVQGEATVIRDDEEYLLRPNESTYIPCQAVHKLTNNGSEELVVVEVQTGGYLGEDDIQRLEDAYGRA